MIKSAETLETQKVELAAQLEKIYEEQAVIKEAMAREHKNHKYMQGKLDIIEANVEKFKVQEKYLKNLIEITAEIQEKAEAETQSNKDAVTAEKEKLTQQKSEVLAEHERAS